MADATEIIKDLLPIAGALISGPIGTSIGAISWLADKLGTKEKTVEAVTDALQGVDPLKRQELEQDFLKWSIDQQNKMELARLADVQDARKRDTDLAKAGQKNFRADMMFILAVIVISWVFYKIWNTPEINEYVKGVATLILGRFLGYLDTIYQFEFGNTRSNNANAQTIQNLTKG